MSVLLWILLAVILTVLVLLIWSYAARVDRLHRRLVSRRLGVDRHLVRRSAEALRLSESSALAPREAAELRTAALGALLSAEYPLCGDKLGGLAQQGSGTSEQTARRIESESALSKALREVLTPAVRKQLESDPLTQASLGSLDEASYRGRVARNLHNQDVLQLRALRANFLVRFFHLAGRAPVPEFVDVDDQD